MQTLTIIVPVYNEEETLKLFNNFLILKRYNVITKLCYAQRHRFGGLYKRERG